MEIFQHLEIVSRSLLENLAALLEILATCPRTSRDLPCKSCILGNRFCAFSNILVHEGAWISRHSAIIYF